MRKEKKSYYEIPEEFWHRIHFVRPRFKGNMEKVLLYMATECCRIPDCSCEEYSNRYMDAIRIYPGNQGKSKKTLDNWRTEIPALFGFYNEDKDTNVTRTSEMAKFLYHNQDLTQFLRLFLYSFQFPGGHLKPKDLKEIIKNNIRFKPAKTIIQVLMAGNEILAEKDKSMSLSAEEATFCIFNDIRVTSGKYNSEKIARTILENRKNKVGYYNAKDSKIHSLKGFVRTKGDVTRYAGDILDYMVTANLLCVNHGYYSLIDNELPALQLFADDTTFFNGYEQFYNTKELDSSMLTKVERDWFNYVNVSMKPELFKTDILSILKQDTEIDVVEYNRIANVINSDDTTTKDIGNLGEAIICGHERMRLKINGYDKFVKLVQIVDSPSYHPGYDIDSFEADGTNNHRYIEVKTTISKNKIDILGFHMSDNEWNVADTIKEHYCVYRLMLNEKERVLFVLRNPVQLFKNDIVRAVSRNGMDITFVADTIPQTELLSWKK